MKKRQSGFTLIELLIVIAIIGILAAIAIPNLLNAVQRGKQKRTMSDMRTLATAVEAYAVDNNTYPPGATCGAGVLIGNYPAVASTFHDQIAPTYVAEPPMVDAWSHAYGYLTANAGQQYAIGSGGRDGSGGASLSSSNCGTTTNFNDDIVYSNGTFVSWPEGSQN